MPSAASVVWASRAVVITRLRWHIDGGAEGADGAEDLRSGPGRRRRSSAPRGRPEHDALSPGSKPASEATTAACPASALTTVSVVVAGAATSAMVVVEPFADRIVRRAGAAGSQRSRHTDRHRPAEQGPPAPFACPNTPRHRCSTGSGARARTVRNESDQTEVVLPTPRAPSIMTIGNTAHASARVASRWRGTDSSLLTNADMQKSLTTSRFCGYPLPENEHIARRVTEWVRPHPSRPGRDGCGLTQSARPSRPTDPHSSDTR